MLKKAPQALVLVLHPEKLVIPIPSINSTQLLLCLFPLSTKLLENNNNNKQLPLRTHVLQRSRYPPRSHATGNSRCPEYPLVQSDLSGLLRRSISVYRFFRILPCPPCPLPCTQFNPLPTPDPPCRAIASPAIPPHLTSQYPSSGPSNFASSLPTYLPACLPPSALFSPLDVSHSLASTPTDQSVSTLLQQSAFPSSSLPSLDRLSASRVVSTTIALTSFQVCSSFNGLTIIPGFRRGVSTSASATTTSAETVIHRTILSRYSFYLSIVCSSYSTSG
ncbi:hypothetical protein BKA64DRAFT_265687 [Cadophora sp. MPI-SDFR-AT-0126]|nr:hypothetical protein BKA64DRAFT_265687 [Leotiomycetes sp. MPI-SDFR-AT-0126]